MEGLASGSLTLLTGDTGIPLAAVEALFLATVDTLVAAIDAKDGYTAGHSRRVGRNAGLVGRSLGLDRQQQRDLHMAATLHDMGKIGIPDHVLQNAGPFDPEQRSQMEGHPAIGADILGRLPYMRPVAQMVRHHHERWDGAGYPHGLVGRRIPLGARIIAVCDTFDAVLSNRIYRRGRPARRAVGVLRREAGQQFDPEIVAAFLRVLAQGWIEVPNRAPAADGCHPSPPPR